MKRRSVLAALGTLVSGCTSTSKPTVEPTGPVDPAGDVARVEERGDGVTVRMTGVGDTHYVRTTIRPMRDPELTPVELSREQVADFPVLRNGLAYFSYDYSGITVKSTGDHLRHHGELGSLWEDNRDADVVRQKRPFRLSDAVFSAWAVWY